MDIHRIRKDFPGLDVKVHGHPLIYFDSAATSQKPQSVINAITEYYTDYTANVHRGIYTTSEKATYAYESVREKVAQFLHAPGSENIVFTKGTTESINMVAYAWAGKHLSEDDEVLITEMEHHSNMVPWQILSKRNGFQLNYIPLNQNGELDLSQLDTLINEKTKLVSITHQSNVFGTVNPIRDIIKMAHDRGAVVLVDGAQSVPHQSVDVQELDCDLLAFSGHKMLGPTGVGVLYGKTEILESMDPFHGGGEMINRVTLEGSTWNDIPHRFEAGTPNIAQVIGLGAAMDYLEEIGMENIHEMEKKITDHARQALSNIHGLQMYCSPSGGAVIPFNIDGVPASDLAQFLDQDGIAIRAGHHCAQPAMDRYGVSSMMRASFYLYNTHDEVDRFVKSIVNILTYFH